MRNFGLDTHNLRGPLKDDPSRRLEQTTRGGENPRSTPRGFYRKVLTDLTASEVLDALSYNPETGLFFWKKNGHPAGYRGGGGYISIGFRGRQYLAHRLAWLVSTGKWPTVVIDHIDGNPSNNCLANLREATLSENHRNTKCRGFYICNRTGRFRSEIKVGDKKIRLGTFSSAEEARAAYDDASRKYFGEFSAVDIRGQK